jgi:hypothetical protein
VSPFVHYEILIAIARIDSLKIYCVRPGGAGGFSPKYQNADGPLVARTERRLGGGAPELQKDFHVDKFPKFIFKFIHSEMNE